MQRQASPNLSHAVFLAPGCDGCVTIEGIVMNALIDILGKGTLAYERQ